MDVDFVGEDEPSTQNAGFHRPIFPPLATVPLRQSPSRTVALESPDKTFRTAKEEQTTRVIPDSIVESHISTFEEMRDVEEEQELVVSPSPQRHAPAMLVSSPLKGPAEVREETELNTQHIESPTGETGSPSEGSSPTSPIRQVRKGSLNFASLPAREPLTAGKSIGARVSRTSHLDHNRTSYYSRPTGGKSLNSHAMPDDSDDEDHDEMDVDRAESAPKQQLVESENLAVNHNKTYTQRLQDSINMLGKQQQNSGRSSKSIPSVVPAQKPVVAALVAALEPKSPSPRKLETTTTTPGAFPEDDDDDWIDPPSIGPKVPLTTETRPSLLKSHTADIMESIHGKKTVGGSEFGQLESQQPSQSPRQQQVSSTRERPSFFGHGKSASVSAVPAASLNQDRQGSPLRKVISVSNPSLAMEAASQRASSRSPAKSPSRSFRDSPLKQVKNKLSSILKTSKGLLASSAALSAEGKSSMLSPSTTRFGVFSGLSSESVVSKSTIQSIPEGASSIIEREASPSRPVARRTRASVEREKEEKRREKEDKRLAEQMDKLEKAREKEREKVRVFSKEQEKIANMEKQVASKKDVEKLAPKETPKPTRISPRRLNTQQEAVPKHPDQDVDMTDAASAMPPPSVPRSIGPGQSLRNKELKRPMKPHAKTKQAPMLIRVNTGSQHSQFAPSSSTLSAGYPDLSSSINSQSQLTSKASKASLQPKASIQSLKGLGSSTGRPKALDLAAKKKEQDEKEAQRRRDAKAEFERKRAAAQEEQRKQEQQRRQELENQKQREREQAEAKKTAQRQAAIEKAKQTRAPPPAARGQPHGPPDYSQSQRSDGPPTRPPSRLNSALQRPQEDLGRPVNTVLSNASKSLAKRPIGQDGSEDGQARRPPSRGGPAYQAKDAKRRRTSDDFAHEFEPANPPNIKGPPVRPSGGLKRVCNIAFVQNEESNMQQDTQTKPMFANGYSQVPQSATRDLFKAAVTSQHTGQLKTAHPLDMAQISKGAIPFAPNPNPSGPSYKTPARPGAVNGIKSAAKSAQRSSPRFQNGESIELPEIQTDDEDDDEDEAQKSGIAPPWADSPDLRRALMRQETMDPSMIFGPPAPLNMEEVFKNKEKWHKFRARTSSANWSGSDRLTEEEIRKDLAARDKIRREGGWSYDMSKEMA